MRAFGTYYHEIMRADISGLAKLLYIYLSNQPENWTVRNFDLEKVLDCKKAKLLKCKKELKDINLLQINQISINGRYDYEYILDDITMTRKTTHCNTTHCRTGHIIKTTNNKNKTNKTNLYELRQDTLDREREQIKSWTSNAAHLIQNQDILKTALKKFETNPGLSDLKLNFIYELEKAKKRLGYYSASTSARNGEAVPELQEFTL